MFLPNPISHIAISILRLLKPTMAIVTVLSCRLVVAVVVAYSTGNTVVTNRYPAIAVVTFSPGIGTSKTLLLLLLPPLLLRVVVVEDGFMISSLDDDGDDFIFVLFFSLSLCLCLLLFLLLL
jgi:hypothetical protein